MLDVPASCKYVRSPYAKHDDLYEILNDGKTRKIMGCESTFSRIQILKFKLIHSCQFTNFHPIMIKMKI